MRSETDTPSLDPATEKEWGIYRQAAHRLLDEIFDQQRALPDGPCWQKAPLTTHQELLEPMSNKGLGLETALAHAKQHIQPYALGNQHPRFWGWVMGGGNLAGMLGQVMSAGMNANVFGGDQGGAHLEKQVIGWFRDLYDFPSVSSGILTDGCSMANLMALAVARHWATEGAIKSLGPEAATGLRLYASDATHNSIIKAAELLGLGSEAVCIVPSHEGRIDLAALEASIISDRDNGLQPFCIVGNAGTVGIGAIDPLEALKGIAIQHGLWLHVDGAFGALGWLSPALRGRLAGLQLADSLAFDLHKWGQVPYEAGCLLVRNGRLHRETFANQAEYLAPSVGGITPPDAPNFNTCSPLLSRPDRALKIWMTLQTHGSERLAGVFEKNVAQAFYLGELVDRQPELERMAPSALNIACFRYRGQLPEAELDAINERIVVQLQESGFAVLSPFRLNGRACLRVAFSNHRTMRSDIEALIETVLRLGQKMGTGQVIRV